MLSFALPVAMAVLAPQEPQTTTRLVPLQHICSPEIDEIGLPWGSLMRYRGNLTADGWLGGVQRSGGP